MDMLLYGMAFVIGCLTTYLLLPKGPGPFEKTIWAGLYEGKRVVVSIGNDAFIFEMNDNRLRITRGTSEFTENPYDGIVANDLGSDGTVESGDFITPNLPTGKGQ